MTIKIATAEKQPEIIISMADLAELEYHLERIKKPEELINALVDEIARAKIVSCKNMPDDVVTLESQVTFKVLGTDRLFTKTLCLPNNMEKYDDSLSVFAPIGAAIIGLSTGQTIKWLIQGSKQSVEIIKVSKKVL